MTRESLTADPAPAAQWIAQRAATPANEEIFRSVTAGLAERNPAVAAQWLKGVTNPAWRQAGERILAERPPAPPAKRPSGG